MMRNFRSISLLHAVIKHVEETHFNFTQSILIKNIIQTHLYLYYMDKQIITATLTLQL
jgi:hypothetical protein